MVDMFPVLRVLGILVMVFALAMGLPLAVSLWTGDGVWHVYPLAMAVHAGGGRWLWWGLRLFRRELQPRHGVMLVSLVWGILPLFAALPLLLVMHAIGRPMSFTHAYFEAVSGLTTTGSTVLVGLDTLPVSVNVWRTFLQWMGGMGILILAVAVLPLLGVGGSQLFKAEAAGPLKDTKLTPRMTGTAKGLWGVYALFSTLCGVAYWAAGMAPLDALMHMFSTVSLGGLSSHDQSFGYFQSPLLEAICIVFMLVASCNFALYFVAIRKGHWHGFWHDPELRATLFTLVGGGLLVAVLLWVKGVYAPLDALRHGMFNVVSVATTTGYATVDYLAWPVFAPVFMLLLSGVATSAGSTGCGIKMVRMLISAQAGAPGDEPLGAPARRAAGAAGRCGGRQPRDLLGAGLHAGVWRHHLRAEHGAAADRSGPGDGVLGRAGQRQLHGAGAGPCRAYLQLCRADRFPDLGVHAGHAAGAT